MPLYRCQMCGGEVIRKHDGLYMCLYCGSMQSFDFDFVGNGQSNVSAPTTEEEIYVGAQRLLASAKASNDYTTAAKQFQLIIGYKDASTLMSQCFQKAEELRIEETYEEACGLMNENNIHFMQQAAELFDTIPNFRDSVFKRAECREFVNRQQQTIIRKNAILQREMEDAEKKQKLLAAAVIGAIVLLVLIFTAIKNIH